MRLNNPCCLTSVREPRSGSSLDFNPSYAEMLDEYAEELAEDLVLQHPYFTIIRLMK